MSADASKRRGWRGLAGIAGVVALYALLGFFAVPALVKHQAQVQVERLGRHLQIGAVAFNPFTFEARVDGLVLTEANGAALIAFRQLTVDADVLSSLRERGAVLDALQLSAPDVALIIEADGSINLARLAPPADDTPPAQDKKALPVLRIRRFAIEAGRVAIEDRSRPGRPFATVLNPIEFSLQDFRTDAGHGNAYEFKGALDSGEEIEWSGEFGLQPVGSRGRFAIRKLQSSTLAAYLQERLPLRLLSGVAEASGAYELALQPTLSLTLDVPMARLRQVAIASRANTAERKPPLSIDELVLQTLRFSLAERALSLQRVGLKGVNVNLRRNADGSLNLQSLLATSPTPPEPPAASVEAPWQVAVAAIELSDSALSVEDRAVQPTAYFSIKPVALTLRDFSTGTPAPLRVLAELGLESGGRLRAEAQLQTAPLAVQAALDVQGLDLRVAQPYLTPHSAVLLQSGVLDVKGMLDYGGGGEGPAPLSFKGDARLNRLRLQDRVLKQDLLQWQSLSLEGIDFHQGPDRLVIDRVSLVEPEAGVVIEADRQLNLTQAFAPQAAVPADPTPSKPAPTHEIEKTAPLPMRFKAIRVERGRLGFTDRSIEPTFSARVEQLRGSIDELSTDAASRARLHFDGEVDRYSPVVIDGTANLLSASPSADIEISFRNMDLIRFNPYSGRFAGYDISKGKLTTELHYRIEQRRLQAQHHVLIDQLEFGDATGSKDAVPIPLKLAVALLKDRRGLIDLQLPVSGDLDDPTFELAPIVGKTLMNLLGRAVTSPFSALASLFGGGEEWAYVDFAPGQATLDATQTDKLTKLAAALAERPQLTLDIPTAVSAAGDAAALAHKALEQQLSTVATGGQRVRALEQVYRRLVQAAPDYPDGMADDAERRAAYLEQSLLARLAPDAPALAQLADQRAQQVQRQLLADAQVAPSRLFLTSGGAAADDAGRPGVRMPLRLGGG